MNVCYAGHSLGMRAGLELEISSSISHVSALIKQAGGNMVSGLSGDDSEM